MNNEQSIEQLIKALWSDNQEMRDRAIDELAVIGEPAVPFLMAALRKDDRNEDLRCYENPDLRKAIIKVGEPAFRALVAALQPGSDMLRAAARTLQQWGDPRAVEPLITVMRDSNRRYSSHRFDAINALAAFRDPRAFQHLVNALSNVDFEIRSAAAHALAEYGDPSSLPAICNALKEKDHDWLYDWEGLPLILSTLCKRSVDNNRGQEFMKHYVAIKSAIPESAAHFEMRESSLWPLLVRWRYHESRDLTRETTHD